MPDYRSLIKSIGLNESEVAVYMAALETGPAQAQLLVKKSGFSRPATYLAIDQLVQKGLMTSIVKGKRNLYAAEPPERLVDFGRSQVNVLSSKVGEIEAVIEDLRLMRKGERPTVKFYEGIEGLKAIMHDLVESHPEMTYEIANLDAVKNVFSAQELESAQKIIAKFKAKGQALLAGKVSRVREGVEARLLPAELGEFFGDVIIYGDKVAMVSFKGKVSGVIAENKVLADTYRILFGLAWKGAEDLPEFGKN